GPAPGLGGLGGGGVLGLGGAGGGGAGGDGRGGGRPRAHGGAGGGADHQIGGGEGDEEAEQERGGDAEHPEAAAPAALGAGGGGPRVVCRPAGRASRCPMSVAFALAGGLPPTGRAPPRPPPGPCGCCGGANCGPVCTGAAPREGVCWRDQSTTSRLAMISSRAATWAGWSAATSEASALGPSGPSTTREGAIEGEE